MSRSDLDTKEQRLRSFEQFEERLVMSAQSVAAVMPDVDVQADKTLPAIVTQQSEFVSEAAEAAHVASQYGFDGSGQTIAVIDSGIAWDHYALGNGFGEGHKVVGGWDFAENDADPYDDGPAGFHGSHVSGIIASEDAKFSGVAPGADLVGLRVFDDAGGGDIKWVEQALQWVHDNIDSFENPITTVNLSLGTDWNAENTPDWATLEDELAQLKADGLFISVAAGNEFEDYNEKGLSYPAASPFVVTVASHGDDNQLSDFSQREDNVLVAPGERVASTVPDHMFGGTETNEYLGATGTSMAAPYVAGASAVLRQANEAMGVSDIDQSLLYQQLWDSANKIYDSVTNTTYRQINLEAALASVVQDDHGDAIGQATDIGILEGNEIVRGTIGQLTDIDQFAFTAQTDGRVTFSFDASDELEPLVEILNSNGEKVAADFTGSQISFDVKQGEQYHFAVATSEGAGHYEIGVSIEEGPAAIDLGTITANDLIQKVTGEQTYKFAASQDGIFTLQGSPQSGSIDIELFDNDGNALSANRSEDGSLRLDFSASKGETFYAIVTANGDVNLQLDNLVSLDDGQLTVSGTNGDDHISVSEASGIELNVNGTEYSFSKNEIDGITIRGQRGNDSVELTLSETYSRASLQSNRFDAIGESGETTLRAIGFESIDIDGGGNLQLGVVGSIANDTFRAALDEVGITSDNSSATARGFINYFVDGKGGSDSIEMIGSEGNDSFFSTESRIGIRNALNSVIATNFEKVSVDGKGGNDFTNLFDSSGDDKFILNPVYARMINANIDLIVNNFERINAFSTQGQDSLTMFDSRGDDHVNFIDETITVSNSFFQNMAKGFESITVTSLGGNDVAQLNGTEGSDRFYAGAIRSTLITAAQTLEINDFTRINMVSGSGGYDLAFITGTDAADRLYADVESVSAQLAEGALNRIVNFDQVEFDGRGGLDSGVIEGSELNEQFKVSELETEFRSTVQLLRMVNTESSHFDGRGGVDSAIFDDFEELDLLSAIGDKATAVLNDHMISVEDIDSLEAIAVDGALAAYDIDKVDFDYSLNGLWKKK